MSHKFNLQISPIDERDYIYKSIIKLQELPSKYDREIECSPIRDQSEYGFCYAFTGAAMKEQQEWKEWPNIKPILSPLFLAKYCKDIDGVPDTEGSYLRVVMEVLSNIGICNESNYLYNSYVRFLKFPEVSTKLLQEASKYKIKSYARCDSLEEVKNAIYNNGLIIGGVLVCDNFTTPENGFVDNPEGSILGLHAINIVGWDDNLKYTYKNGKTRKGFLKCRNSWGIEYGNNGYFYLPYDFYYGKSDTFEYFFETWSSIDNIENIPEPAKQYFRVQLGAFSVVDNAIKLKNKLISLNIPAIIKQVGNLYKVQVGVFLSKENSYKKLEQMKLMGFKDAFVVFY